MASVGVLLSGLAPLPDLHDAAPAWVVLVGLPGNSIAADNDEARTLLRWLLGLRPARSRLELVTICAGVTTGASTRCCTASPNAAARRWRRRWHRRCWWRCGAVRTT